MKKIFLVLMILISTFSLFGCTLTIPNQNNDEKTEEGKVETKEENEKTKVDENPTEEEPTKGEDIQTKPVERPEPTPNTSGKDYYDEIKTESLYSDLFDINNKITVKINISEAEITKIEADYEKYGSECNIYHIAESVSITIEYSSGKSVVKTINEVGIRMKGNTTRHSFYEDGITSLIHFKLDFQETFDDSTIYSSSEIIKWNDETKRENRKNRTFFGLRGLELKYNAEGDLTYTRDVYASYVYKTNGIYAQSTTLGVLDFNIDGKSNKSGTLGVYKIYEPVDRVFVKRYFESNNNDGDLYKASWGSAKGMPSLNSNSVRCYGVDNSAPGVQKSISYDLKTNKTKSNHASIKALLDWINGSSNDLSKTLPNYINEEYYVTWLALMYITGDWDNFMYDSNNYYMYFDENEICYFIPYDMDRTFGLQAKMHDMANIKPLSTWNLQGDGNRSKLLKKTIDVSNSNIRTKYLLKVKELSSKVLNTNKFKEFYDIIYKNYKDEIIPTMKTLVYDYEDKTSNPFYHLIIGNGEYIKFKDSTANNNAFDSYFSKKQEIINKNC